MFLISQIYQLMLFRPASDLLLVFVKQKRVFYQKQLVVDYIDEQVKL